MKKMSGTLRLDQAAYRALEAFARFGSDLDKSTQQQLRRGERVNEILKQNQYSPFPVERQVVIIYAVNNGYLDELPKDACRRFEQELFERMEVRNKEVLNMIADKAELNAEIEGKLNEVLKDFSSAFKATL
jgi:F-type H+-transporting ATPase subunit alpha